MRVPVSWLAAYTALPDDLDELVATLDDLGLVVEGVEQVGRGLDDVVVVRVERIDPIEGADRIRLATVHDGHQSVEVVCGAWNFDVGALVPLAPVGAVLPDGTAIARRTMRGVTSNGMLCSGRELGLGEDHEGLLVLEPADGVVPGRPLLAALGIVPDTVLDIAIEGNRPDAWCVEGIARDLAARARAPFHPVVPAPPAAGPTRADQLVAVEIVDPDLCGRFTATVLEGVTVEPSPEWVQRRLERCGMRPINNVVDASNYVMLELGQPTHAYDRDRLAGAALRVRRAAPGEDLALLDGTVVELAQGAVVLGDTGEDLVICDGDDTPIGLAGIMGGASTEIDGTTTTVVLEAAWFDPMAVARSAKRHRLRTEASARFERGCDPMACDRAAARVVELLAETSPSLRVAAGLVDARGTLPVPAVLTVDAAGLAARLGVTLELEEVARLLSAIGFVVRAREGALEVTAPTARPDVRPAPFGLADVAEEVARLYGYAALPTRVPSWPAPGAMAPVVSARRSVREALVGLGALEAWTATMVGEGDAELLGDEAERVRVTNPVAQDEPVLRSSLLPGLLGALRRNVERRQGDVALFEVGTTFAHHAVAPVPRLERGGSHGTELVKVPSEDERVALLLARPGDGAHTAVVSWRALREALRLADVRLDVGRGAPPHGVHPTRFATLVDAASTAVVGVVGEVDPSVAARAVPGLDPARRLGWLDVSLGVLVDPELTRRLSEVAVVPSRFPTSDVDLALVVDESIGVHEVKAVLRAAAGELCESVACFDAYRGAGIPDGAKSLALRVRLGAPDRTLSEAALGEARAAMIDAAATRLRATLR
ncbi:MAG TPA: phenylalanine--tRNA ligase subunit beta [Acidimicrobiales bacterium]|jgi:phenylalanyl-tRNA synthetase beta chain|nr:phenylalanine--tRNA ligase subunit beta [Acidimicrobiales bacterium]